jgi:hypothetical protein
MQPDAKGKTALSSNSKVMAKAVWNGSKNPCAAGLKRGYSDLAE